jgi:NADH-quinone oxidoreductase subunit I
MGQLVDALRAMRTTLVTALRKPTTVEFPAVIRPRAERFRASFALPDDEHGELACIGCLACERICPSQVIKMKPTGKRDSPVTGKKRQYVETFVLDLSACIGCELCVQVCNSDAIRMVREPEAPGFSREDLVLDLERLRANARTKTLAWGRGSDLQAAQEPPKAEKKPSPKPVGEGPRQTTEPEAAPPLAPPVAVSGATVGR